MIDLESKFNELSDTAVFNIEDCLAARNTRTESSITDFTCPSGDYNTSDRPHTDEVLAYQLAVATVFAAIDEDALKYSKSLQCMRERDPIKWTETNRIVIHGDGASVEWYSQKYHDICDETFIIRLINTPTQKYIKSTDFAPQWFDCKDLADAKVQALDNLTALLAANGIGKWYENDKDKFITQVKGKYKTLIVKLADYMKLVSTAVSKLDTYLTNTIR